MASSSCNQRAYDVYVSYRTEEVRKTFIDHLFSDLKRKGIYCYEKYNQSNTENEASSELYKAIVQSRILIVVFSRNYASSTSCLKELVKMIECKEREKGKYEVWPIFYDIEPAMVRNQTGCYEEALLKHEAPHETEVVNWKKALTFAGNLSGWDLQNLINGDESKFIDIISKKIFYKLIDGPIHAGSFLVGLDAHTDHMKLLNFVESNKVNMIGLCGIGGIGKTTIAKAIYNLMYKHFEACSFCENVKNIATQNGLVHLQKKLLDDIIKDEILHISSIGEGVNVIKRLMKGKKVLIVVDDVDLLNQFEALAGKRDWFGVGSMIVVTSRDKQLLESCQVEHVYEIEVLNDDDSRELFNKYAFGNKKIRDEYTKLTNIILEYANGLPFALKTFGSFLFNKSLHEWGVEIDKFQTNRNELIQQVLRVLRESYDELDTDQKNVFLDIACFFKGQKKEYVVKILDDCDLYLATNLRVLVDKSLITICEDRIEMHNLVQEMGRQIVRDESEGPGKRSRLWCPTDVSDVLTNDKGTELVQGLALDLSCSEVDICGQSFTKLKNLRLLNIYIGALSSVRGTNSVKCKGFKKLTLLKLSHCPNLIKTPDFTETQNLKELILDGCENLVRIHPSIGTLKMLIFLNLKNCKNLKILPNITQLESLKHLILSGCSKMENLSEIRPSWHSFFSLSSLLTQFFHPVTLVLPSLSSLVSLTVLDVSHCNISSSNLCNLESLRSLEELDISGNDFSNIDANFSWLTRLSCLRLIGCKNLQVLPELPSTIVNLDAQSCVSLHELPKLSTVYNAGRAVFDFKNCPKVAEKQTIDSLLTALLPQGRFDVFEEVHIFLPGSRTPSWFCDKSMGDYVKVELPTDWDYKDFKGLATCAIITPKNHDSTSTFSDIYCTVKNTDGDLIDEWSHLATDDPNFESDQILLSFRISHPKWKKVKNQITVSFKCCGINCKVKQCGVRLVCKEV
ncbi:disease resistance protein Roq1-like isoform X2 [Rutidosis leptorrhynchoides]|uniref:disease resistance protein Roq1-like isoform X2 n=1 Tax=Rutidosis leptorrhynchoides TaxID=125765 RepID=UPI003A9928C7